MKQSLDELWSKLESGQDTQQDVQECIRYAKELEDALEKALASNIDACMLLVRANYLLGIETLDERKLTADIRKFLKESKYYGK